QHPACACRRRVWAHVRSGAALAHRGFQPVTEPRRNSVTQPMHRLLLTLASVVVFTGHSLTQDAPLKRLGYWGVTLRAPRLPPPGAEVTEVRAGSPADRLHLHKGDRFLRANGRPIMTGRDIDEYLLRFRE